MTLTWKLFGLKDPLLQNGFSVAIISMVTFKIMLQVDQL